MEMLKAGGRKVVGTKQVLRALKAGTVKRVYAANDADTFIFQQVVRGAESAGIPFRGFMSAATRIPLFISRWSETPRKPAFPASGPRP